MSDQDTNNTASPDFPSTSAPTFPTGADTTNQAPVIPPVQAAQAQPNAAQNAPKPAPAPTPADLHALTFRNLLGVLAGGSNRPVQNPDGSPQTNPDGSVKMAPASKVTLGKSIVAAALSSMIAGMATPDKYTKFGEGESARMVPDYSGAVAAGANAAAPYTQAGSKTKAQQEAEENQARSFSTFDHNLKMHQLMIANAKADTDTQQDSVDDWQDMNDAMAQEEAKGGLVDSKGNPIKSIYSFKEITPEELYAKLNSKEPTVRIAADQVSPARVVQVLGQDGQMHPQTLFNVYNPDAMIALTDELKTNHPELAHAVGRVPIRAIANAVLNENEGNLAKSGLSDQLKGYDAANGTHLADTFDLKAEGEKNTLIQKLYPLINKYRSDSLPAMFHDIKTDKNFAGNATIQAANAKLQEAMGITPDGLQKQTQTEAEAVKQKLQNDKEFTLDSAVGASTDDSNPVRQQKAKKWLATYQAVQATIAGVKTTANEKAKEQAAGTSNFADFNAPDALGYQPTSDKFAGNEKDAIKQYNKVKTAFKKNADDLSKMEGTYQQFSSILNDVKNGKDLTGAQSVVALFNAIGISAEPLAGKGFRINSNTIEEHKDALSMPDNLVKKSVSLFKNGEVVTPQQIKDYANIALQTRQSKYVNLVNQAHNQGLNADFVLPTGNGEKIDAATAGIFLQLAGGNAAKARAAATAKGWNF